MAACRSGFVMFEPDGTQFSGPVTWTIAYSGSLPIGTYVPCYYWLESEARWGQPVPGHVIDLGAAKKACKPSCRTLVRTDLRSRAPPSPQPPAPPTPRNPSDPASQSDNPKLPMRRRASRIAHQSDVRRVE